MNIIIVDANLTHQNTAQINLLAERFEANKIEVDFESEGVEKAINAVLDQDEHGRKTFLIIASGITPSQVTLLKRTYNRYGLNAFKQVNTDEELMEANYKPL